MNSDIVPPMHRPARTYKDAIAALNSLQSNFASIEAIRKLGPSVDKNELSIAEVREYTRRLGYTPADFNRLNLIHVTGTKGKGSTCAFTESILQQYSGASPGITKIGLFTSPHLKTVRERIRIDGRPISEPMFTKYFFEVWDKLSSTTSSPQEFPSLQPCLTVKPMYFKYLTLLSFHVFASENVDTAIYEVGVGGTYDSTNIIDKPTVTAILALGIDHTFMLGSTIESIATNKTGIFKRGLPAVVARQIEYPQSELLVESRAAELGVSSLEFVDEESVLPKNTKLGLLGSFQRQNAALAVKIAAIHLASIGVPPTELPDFSVSPAFLPDKFIAGLEHTKWDGRCQIIANKPSFENITWYIDGAHTLESINVASKWFLDVMKKSAEEQELLSKPVRPRVLLFNQQSRENAKDLLARLHSNTTVNGINFNHVVFTTNITWSDGNYNADLVSMNNSKELIDKLTVQKELADTWNSLNQESNHTGGRKHVFHDIETSINFIKSLANDTPSGVDVFICGSLHLVGGVLVVLDNERD